MAAKESPHPTKSPASGGGADSDGAPPSGPPPSEQTRREGVLALNNGIKLAASLVLTWGVALIITFKLPKYLGPEPFGWYRYGFDFALSAAVFIGLGVDTYISREVAVRPKHASDFFGGVVVMRGLVLIPVFLYGAFHLQHKRPEEQLAAALFGVTQVFIVMNQTFQQTLQAASKVGGLAIANVVAKVLWGGGLYAAISLKTPFWVLPLPMLAAEALKAGFLYAATKDAVGLRVRVDWKATIAVLKVSAAFFVANAAVQLGSSIDLVILRELVGGGCDEVRKVTDVAQATDRRCLEVGWYGAARETARLSALMSPVLSGVLVPMMSRAKHRSEEEFFKILRRGIEGVNVVSIPLTLMLALGADFFVRLVFKAAFAPAAASLRWLAPTFVLAYQNVLLWVALMILGRAWTITIISIAGLALLPAFILPIVPLAASFGDGGRGMGVAMAISARELVIVIVFFLVLGKRALDRRSVLSTVKSLTICVAVVGLDFALTRWLGTAPPLLVGARLALDALAYALLALAIGVIRPADVKDVLRMIKDRKKLQSDPVAT
jgi:O-antigen/teichoic acid export membrane protein